MPPIAFHKRGCRTTLHRRVAEAKAQRIIAEELEREGDLLARRKKDSVKFAIAARLRPETTYP